MDGAQESATTAHRLAAEPAIRLHEAALRYDDALNVAPEAVFGSERLHALDTYLERLAPGLAEEPAFPTLRSKLVTAALDGHDPLPLVRDALYRGSLDNTEDLAAVLDWRIAWPTNSGPLPWLPGIPAQVAGDPVWGGYLSERSDLIHQLADRVAQHPPHAPWTDDGLPLALRSELSVWRAAFGIPDTDPLPTGPALPGGTVSQQHHLNRKVRQALDRPQVGTIDWSRHLPPEVRRDSGAGVLRTKLTELHGSGIDVPKLVETALAERRVLPVENPADALWWRIVGAHAKVRAATERRAARVPVYPSASRLTSRHESMPFYSIRIDRPRGPAR